MTVSGVRAGLGTVVLVGVDIQPRWLEGVRVHLDHVVVGVSVTLAASRLEVHGGTVEISGSLEALRKRWRGRRGMPAGSAAGPRVPLRLDGLAVEWSGAFDSDAVQRIWGLSYERGPEGAEVVGADLVRVQGWGSGAEIGAPRLRLERMRGVRSLAEVSARSVGAHVDLDGRLLESLLRSERPPASPGGAVPKSAQRGARLRAALGEVASAGAAILAPGAKVELAGLRAELRRAGQRLNIGPARLTVAHTGGQLDVRLIPGEGSTASTVTLALQVPLDGGAVNVELAGGPVSLATLGVREGDMGLVDVADSHLEVRGRATLAPDGSVLEASGRYRLARLSLRHEKLAPDVVRGIDIGGSGTGTLALDGSHVVVKDAELSVGRVALQLSADIERGSGAARGSASLRVPLAFCQDLYDSTPQALLPDLKGMRFDGNFSFSGEVAFDTDRPSDMQVGWKVANACRITSVPARVAPQRFTRAFERIVEDAAGQAVRVESGPGTDNWVPLYEISPHMETAIIVCEDARFRLHEGFDQKAIADSIKDNLKAGRFVRGASTVTMQLAKNLYLERDKTLSRKLQEAVLTQLLEQELSKDQILELYLNVIEFGPGIYGIRAAAAYYFASEAEALTLAQCMYLASILPNPKAGHFNPDGSLGDRWRAYIDRLVRIAHKIHRATDAELEAALQEELRFGEPAPDDVDTELEAPGASVVEPGGNPNVERSAPSPGDAVRAPDEVEPPDVRPEEFEATPGP